MSKYRRGSNQHRKQLKPFTFWQWMGTSFFVALILMGVFNSLYIKAVEATSQDNNPIISPVATTVNNTAVAPTVAPSQSEATKSATLELTQPKDLEHQQIIDYIKEVFGKDSDKAFELLSCENSALNPDAVSSTQDYGVFQISTHWQQVQPKFLTNYKINIEIAHQLFEENHGHFNLWTCGRKLGL